MACGIVLGPLLQPKGKAPALLGWPRNDLGQKLTPQQTGRTEPLDRIPPLPAQMKQSRGGSAGDWRSVNSQATIIAFAASSLEAWRGSTDRVHGTFAQLKTGLVLLAGTSKFFSHATLFTSELSNQKQPLEAKPLRKPLISD